MVVTLSSEAKVNSVILIASVEPHDQARFETLRDALTPVLTAERCPFFVYQVASKDELLELMQNIANQALAGLTPVLQLLMHGSAQEGLICSDRSILSWHEAHESLKSINFYTGNNLVVISAVCHSLAILKGIKITSCAPFYILIAPEVETLKDFVEENIPLFFLDVFRGRDIVKSYELNLERQFKIFHCEAVLFISMVRYFRDSCIGKGAIQRKEALITEGRSMGTLPNRKAVRRNRSLAKKMIRPNQDVLDRFRRMFLLGRDLSYTYKDVEKVAREAKDAQHAVALAELKLAKDLRRQGKALA